MESIQEDKKRMINMSGSNVNWLPHLTNEMIPNEVHGINLSVYSIALEGWRRGLKLKFFPKLHEDKYEIQFSLSNENRKHIFTVTKGDKVQDSAVLLCNDKTKCKEVLQKAGLLVPIGKNFKKGSNIEKIISFANDIGYPVILKTNISMSKKINSNVIKTEKELIETLSNEKINSDILVEKYITGENYRIYVLDGQIISVIKKIPAKVIGDGKHTIKELIEIKNLQRKNNPYLQTKPIKIDEEIINNLHKKDYTLNTILKSEEKLYLKSNCHISSGGDTINFTNNFPDSLKKLVLKAVDAIPGLYQCSVDVIVDNDNNGYVLEIDTQACIASHIFPVEGNAIDVPKAIIDYYFPETKNNERLNLYFDFSKIINILRRGLLKEMVVSNQIQTTNMKKQYYEAYGDVNTNKFHNWLLKYTLNLNLNGFAKSLENGVKCIVIYGEANNVDKFHKLLEKNVPLMVNTTYDNEYLSLPIKVGFEIID